MWSLLWHLGDGVTMPENCGCWRWDRWRGHIWNGNGKRRSAIASKATSHDYERLGVDPPLLDGPLPGIKSNTPPLQILLACCESFAAATKFYEREFSIDPSYPETYFNFYQDTLYIRHDTFSWSSEGAESMIDALACFSESCQKSRSSIRS